MPHSKPPALAFVPKMSADLRNQTLALRARYRFPLVFPHVRGADRAGQQLSGAYRNKLTLARSMISSPRPLKTAFSMNKLKPLACSRVIVGGIASS